jgi:hypothetical protein
MMNTLFASLLLVTCLTDGIGQNIHGDQHAAACFLSSVRFSQESRGQTPDQVAPATKNEEALTPLTDNERLLNFRDIISNQPDFIADLSFSLVEHLGAHGNSKRIARKGSRYRIETENRVIVGEIGIRAVSLDLEAKLYDDMQMPTVQASEPSMLSLKTWSQNLDIAFSALGNVQIDGHKCTKIEAARKGEERKVYLYVARDLNNLVILVRLIDSKTSEIQELRNISLQVPDSLVEIPAEFKPIEHDLWTKLESAKVTFKGEPSQRFAVFRAPGGELFIWVDGEQYLVRPGKGTAEIAFEGLLVNRSGEYIWRTNEAEAFSRTSYRTRTGPLTDQHILVTANSVTFQSRSYNREMIVARW